MQELKGKNIVLGITGGIAAYKMPELIRLFVKAGANVDVILTESATKFLTPLTISTLTRNNTHIALFDPSIDYNLDHISLADKADLFLIAPATANIIGKIAHGIADDLLTTSVMATKCPVLIAPAMNVNMWENSIVQHNITQLKTLGYNFIPPEEGDLACGYKGSGRLASLDNIYHDSLVLLSQEKPLHGKKIIVTAGGTREYIDPVRFITNKSSGKMGYAIADKAVSLGAEVILVTTVTHLSSKATIVPVETAEEMLIALKQSFPATDALIMAAAVADYRPESYTNTKIKKSEDISSLSLKLTKNPDILKELASLKTEKHILIGFAAETDNLIQNAKRKLEEKKLDLIVANDVSREDVGMNSDFNEVQLIYPDGTIDFIEKNTKEAIAEAILSTLRNILNDISSI